MIVEVTDATNDPSTSPAAELAAELQLAADEVDVEEGAPFSLSLVEEIEEGAPVVSTSLASEGIAAMEEEEDLDGGTLDEANEVVTLVVGELSEPWMQDESYLRELFKGLGVKELAACRVARDRSMPHGVVQLSSSRVARRVMEKHSGRVPVLFPHRYMLRPAKTACSVYVGQLDFPFVTPSLLRYLFAGEQIAHTHLPLDEAGKGKGYGFVTFTNQATATRVIKTHHNNPLGRGKHHSLRVAPSDQDASDLYFEAQPPAFNEGVVVRSEGLVDGDDPPHAILARAQELHLLAQSPTQAAEVRMEMLAKSRRLLEGLIGSLEAAATAAH